MPNYNYEQLLIEAHENLSILQNKLGDFDIIYEELQQLPKDFSTETKKVSEAFIDAVKVIDELKVKLDNNVDALKKEIDRLISTDFKRLFEALQKEFIKQAREDIANELEKFKPIVALLQEKINALKSERDRLEKIDLEKGFRELQDTLSQIFQAIQGINISLTQITQSLSSIARNISNLTESLNTNFKETRDAISKIDIHLINQNIEVKKNVELLENKIQSLAEQNVVLKKEIKTNRIIQIAAFTILMVAIFYIIITKQ